MFTRKTFKYRQSDSVQMVTGYAVGSIGYFVQKKYYKVIHIPSGIRICSFLASHYTVNSRHKDAARKMCIELSKIKDLETNDIESIPQKVLTQILKIEEDIRQEF